MIISEWTKNIRGVKLQRNYSICLNVFLSALLLLALLVLVRTAHKTTTVLVPVGLSQESIVGTKGVSDSYLIQWTEFMTSLMLNVTPETIAHHQHALLPYISNAAYGKFRTVLIKEQDQIVTNGISTVFYPKETKVIDKAHFKTKTTGLLNIYIGDMHHDTKTVSYELGFDYINNRLLLNSMSEVARA
ncbi:MAG: type IV conjugative transfer system protein TraE [Candidatus Berkiella sp.]